MFSANNCLSNGGLFVNTPVVLSYIFISSFNDSTTIEESLSEIIQWSCAAGNFCEKVSPVIFVFFTIFFASSTLLHVLRIHGINSN